MHSLKSFFFEFLLLSKKNKTLPDKLLVVWMFLIGLHLLIYYLIDSGVAQQYPVIYGIIGPIPLVHGPLLYLYTLALTGRMSRWNPVQLLHFTPVLVFYVVSIRFFLMSVEEQRQFIQALLDREGPLFYNLGPVWILASAITYQILALALFRKHKRNLKDQYSYSDEKINLNWLRHLTIGLAAVWLAVIVSYMMLNVLKDDDLIFTAVVLFVIFFGYFGVKQGNIFITPPESLAGSMSGPGSADQKIRYEKSGLKKEVAEKLETQLRNMMEKDKLFLDDSLTLVKKINAYVSRDITDRIPNGNEVTVRQLLNHTSGIPEHLRAKSYLEIINGSQSKISAEEALDYIYGKKPLSAPGEESNYSNSNYLLLALIIRNVSKASSAYEVLKERIIEPLGLENTYPGTEIPSNMSLGYYEYYGHMKELTEADNAAVGGEDRLDGGIISSSYDMALFLEALMSGQLVSQETLNLMLDVRPVEIEGYDHITGYGLGLMQIETSHGMANGHYGSVHCFHSAYYYFPEDGTTVAYTLNGGSAELQELAYSEEAINMIFE